jgi:SPP1 family predicted phage head-tail adaptor
MVKALSIGFMDQRVTFQSEALVDDGQGGRTSGGWSDIASAPTVWAKVDQSTGGEGENGEYRQANEYQIDVVIRNRDDVHDRLALVWRGRRYNIRSVLPYDARREFLLVRAVNGVAL